MQKRKSKHKKRTPGLKKTEKRSLKLRPSFSLRTCLKSRDEIIETLLLTALLSRRIFLRQERSYLEGSSFFIHIDFFSNLNFQNFQNLIQFVKRFEAHSFFLLTFET